MRIYDEFCAAVTAQVHNATPQEKAAIRQELAEHLEDHAAYLTEEHGLSPEEASEAAIAAMGDPAEIGQELNEKYPRRWRIWYFLCKTLAILCIVLTLYPLLLGFFTQLDDIRESMQARHYVSNEGDVLPMDTEIIVGNQVLRLYGVKYDLYGNHPELVLYFLTYDRIPWHNASEDLVTLLEISDVDGNPLSSLCYRISSGSCPVYHRQMDVLVDAPPEALIISYDSRGQQFSERVSIPVPEQLPEGWEVVRE